jgi:zinc/manganese transport system permease protein
VTAPLPLAVALGAPAVFGGPPPFSWNLVSDFRQMWSYEFFQHAFEAGTIVAVVAGVIGYFVVLRRSAFAGHALSHIGFAGAAGAVVLGVNPLWGLLVFCVGAGGVMGALGQRLRARDTVIGIVLAFSLGLGALFLSLYHGGDANAAVSILFGEILGVSTGDVLLTLVIGVAALAMVALVYRPLLFASVDEDVAEARRVPVRALSVAFMVTLALAVAVAVQVVGVLLIFALLVTPAALAERVTRRPWTAISVSVGTALVCTWIGLAISWYSNWAVSFFITTAAFILYLAVRLMSWVTARVRRGRGIGLRSP